ncbi:MAG: hypothetical protein LV480_05635 [Methylacidiphilales bacterium]|nr:hypothetical protein [Candidatus Methylacidiphilales bacterium]
MADNPPPDPKSDSQPPLPSSGTTGRMPSPATHLPVKKGGAGKIVVMLSSVAKPPPVAPGADSTPQPAPAKPSLVVTRPPPLPPKQVSPATTVPIQTQPRLNTTTHVKLPPKTAVPHWGSLSGKPVPAPVAKDSPTSHAPPPAPVKAPEPIRSEPKKSGAQLIPPIRFDQPPSQLEASGESIFPSTVLPKAGPKPEGAKKPEPVEINPPTGDLQSLEAFERSQRASAKPTPETPLVAPPLRPPARVETPAASTGTLPSLRPPPLPPAPLQTVPPLLEKEPEPAAEKLPQPNLPADVHKGDTPAEPAGVTKVPALIQPEASSIDKPSPAKPLSPPALPVARGGVSKLKKSTPIVVSSTSAKLQAPKIAEAKPALRPAVLPSKSLPSLEKIEVAETAKTPGQPDTKPPAVQSPEPTTSAPPPVIGKATPPWGEKEKATETARPALPPPFIPVSAKAKGPLPATRAERAKKRRMGEIIFFWVVLFPLTVAALYYGSLRFGRDTRVEGQVIPPSGMLLKNEVWIVTDFSSLASGVTEDLAADRIPLEQEIQERQDHVQRAQADLASREERIRFIQQQILASKQEIETASKQSRDQTQQIWDSEGAAIDADYTARFNQLKQLISDRAKSLKLNYAPDPNYPSPEVWANAYRLALYQVPPGVDSVKEHQWLGDQMTQWRNFLKTLDDRKEQLREKAAALKTAVGPKIADLNSKITDLQQRADGTVAEEEPLKAELQQAQDELAQAQTTEAGLDDKYYEKLYPLPDESISKRIMMGPNGRFTWMIDEAFVEGEKERSYWIFARATRSDGRQYWALHRFTVVHNQKVELYIEPTGFISTKAILRPDLSPEEQEQ